MSQKIKDVLRKHFRRYVAPDGLCVEKLDLARGMFSKILDLYSPYAEDKNHPNYLIADFILYADECLSRDGPIESVELRNIAQAWGDDFVRIARDLRSDAKACDKFYLGLDVSGSPILLSTAEVNGFEILKKSLRATPNDGQNGMLRAQLNRAENLRFQADVLDVQVDNLRRWLRSDNQNRNMFFSAYFSLRIYERDFRTRKQGITLTNN